MKEYISSLRTLLLLALTVCLAACQQDDVTKSAREYEASKGISVSANLAVTFDSPTRGALDEPNRDTRTVSTPDGEAVNINVVVGDVASKAKKDDNTMAAENNKQARLDNNTLIKMQPTIKMLLLLRKKGDTKVSYNYKTWTYNATKNRYELNGELVDLPEGVTTADDIEGRLFAGGYYDEATHTMRVPAGLGQVIDMDSPNVTLPIPFASSWVNMTKGSLSVNYNSSNNNVFNLYPVGVLMTTTLRNTSKENLSIAGVDVQSNALNFGEIAFKLTDGNVGDQARTTIPEYTSSKTTTIAAGTVPTADQVGVYNMPEVEDTYYRFQVNPSDNQRITLTKQEKNTFNIQNKKVVVVWGMPVPGKQNGSISRVPNTTKSFFTYAQTHVYARDVKNESGQAVTKPNYDLVPIMGTDFALTNGYAYTLNAELFDQPNVILGYYAKYTMNREGTAFNKTHERKQVNYMSYYVARDFAKGKELTNTDGVKSTFYLPTSSSLTLLGLNAGPAFKPINSGNGEFGSGTAKLSDKYRSQSWPTGVRKELGGVHHVNGVINFGEDNPSDNTFLDARYYAFNNDEPNLAYGITNKSRNFNSALIRAQQEDQTLWRYELLPKNDDKWLGTPTKGGVGDAIRYTYYNGGVGEDLGVKALFVGKFFVGNPFSPIYKGANLLDETNVWKNNEATRNFVERYIPARGLIDNTGGSYNPQYTTALQNRAVQDPFPGAKPTKASAPYWSLSNGYTTARAMYWWKDGIHTDKSALDLLDLMFKQAPLNYNDNTKVFETITNYMSVADAEGRYMFPDGTSDQTFVFRWRDMPINQDWVGNAGSFGSIGETNYKNNTLVRMFLPLLPWSPTYQGDTKD